MSRGPLPYFFAWLLMFGWAPKLRVNAEEAAAAHLPILTVAVRVHLMQSVKKPNFETTLMDADVRRIFEKVNMIWAQAGIRIEIEKVVHTEALDVDDADGPNQEIDQFPANVPKEALSLTALNIFYVKTLKPNGFYYGNGIVVKDTAKLKPVPGGLDEPIPRVTAHELGHAFGLRHRQDGNNLMASGLNAYLLNEDEIKTAREKALAIQTRQQAGATP